MRYYDNYRQQERKQSFIEDFLTPETGVIKFPNFSRRKAKLDDVDIMLDNFNLNISEDSDQIPNKIIEKGLKCVINNKKPDLTIDEYKFIISLICVETCLEPSKKSPMDRTIKKWANLYKKNNQNIKLKENIENTLKNQRINEDHIIKSLDIVLYNTNTNIKVNIFCKRSYGNGGGQDGQIREELTRMSQLKINDKNKALFLYKGNSFERYDHIIKEKINNDRNLYCLEITNNDKNDKQVFFNTLDNLLKI